ncbi:MAG: FAD-dependent oxidoreductase [Thermoleophilia bacterium]|nr:FAD-dependent oxidoreductase [Thermoleophilia bacterium]
MRCCSRTVVSCRALACSSGLCLSHVRRCLTTSGLERTKAGTVAVDGWGRTNVPRVWAAGDVAEPAPSAAVAIAAGSRAAAGITHALLISGHRR